MSRKEAINKISIVVHRIIEMFTAKLNNEATLNQCGAPQKEMNLATLLFNEQTYLDMPKKSFNQSSFLFYYGSKKRSKGQTKGGQSAL